MTTLAAVLAAWADSDGKHTWRNPTDWDTRVLTALTEWGYQPSDVESLLLDTPDEPDTTTGPTTPAPRPDPHPGPPAPSHSHETRSRGTTPVANEIETQPDRTVGLTSLTGLTFG